MGVVLASGGGYATLNESLPWLDRLQFQVPLYGGSESKRYEQIWREQPNVRTVVDFLGRNIAQLGLHVYRRVSDTDRERVTDHPLVATLTKPNPTTTRYRAIDALVRDLAIYDRAYWAKVRAADGSIELRRLPPGYTFPVAGSWLEIEAFRIFGPKGEHDLDPDTVVFFRGYSPTGVGGESPMETLHRLIQEDYAAGEYRQQMWGSGARMSGWLERPLEAPGWSPEARARFTSDWRARWAGSGPDAGGTPILEDGMQFHGESFTARESQWIEGRKLTREEVAAAYFIPPPMVGILDNATFSNITEQHKMLYQDTLGPWLTMIAEELQLQLLPEYPDTDGLYLEFNIAEKLRGSFEEQASAMQTAVGGPWLTRNEARARSNLPSLAGGDELIVPLNVLEGGQASPTDSAPGTSSRLPRRKALSEREEARARLVAKVAEVLEAHAERQRRSVTSALGGSKAIPSLTEAWGDPDRWNAELAADLFPVLLAAATAAAGFVVEEHEPDFDFDPNPMVAYITAMADAQAEATNTGTYEALALAVASSDWDQEVAGVFERAKGDRARGAARSATVGAWNVGTSDAAKAVGLGFKTWRVRSSHPRKSHARIDGETVALGERFSNGGRWPGDRDLKTDERANCTCDLEVTK